MNLRRSTLSLLATAALLGGLTACGGDDEPAAAEQASGTAATGTTDAAAGGDAAAGDAGAGGVDAMAGNNAPGTGADAYKSDDPYVPGNTKATEGPKEIVAADVAFVSKTYKAKAGETWTFRNADVLNHNVQTDDEDPNYKNPMKFKSPDAAGGQKVTFKMPTKPGKYKVLCYYHQNMTATVTVTK